MLVILPPAGVSALSHHSPRRRSILLLLFAFVFFSSVHNHALSQDAADLPGKTVDSDADVAPAIRPVSDSIRPSMVTIRVEGRDRDQRGIGAGFVIDSDGLIATNSHVIGEGRAFTVERYAEDSTKTGEKLQVIAVEASDRNADLAIIRVRPGKDPLPALTLSTEPMADQGTRVLAFGNPLGLRDSVVEGIVSAVREIDGQPYLQLAMPTQPGNSGGPLVKFDGSVVGIVNMKSAIDDNLGFAIPVERLRDLMQSTNPITIDRWVRMGTIDPSVWMPLMGAQWVQRGGMISARGQGAGFGGRALVIRNEDTDQRPLEIAVDVRLNDPSGAAGLVFHSDGQDKHYGFYPSAGKLRLTCFKGPSVYSWEILDEVESSDFVPGQWNRLRVRLADERIECYVNDALVIQSADQQLTSGRVGLAKFRGTEPDFKAFRIGTDLSDAPIADETLRMLADISPPIQPAVTPDSEQLAQLAQASDAVNRTLRQRAAELRRNAEALEKLAGDVQQEKTLDQLSAVLQSEDPDRLVRATLVIAKLDNPEIDIDAYQQQFESMAGEIRGELAEDADDEAKRQALDRYLFVENGFHGGRAEYYHVANSHLNRVIDDREGLPITLSILYMDLGRRLGLDIQGIGLPGHFVAAHVSGDDQQLIDVFDGGELLSRDDARNMVRQFARRDLQEDDLRAQTDTEILTRVLSNLMGIATRSEDVESMLRYIEAIVHVNPDAADYRMMRAQLRAMTQRTSRALEDLQWLLDHEPPGIDLFRVQRMIDALDEPR
ncbi:transglutaminase family protein [Stieleria varia]|uniref:Putative serine protease HtrA n=1 Tax=Stieleria varia TaxID=2528005 RepID=A0A5C6B5Q7_9BACT|nr:tetratricopeptide repeat protein [Stieleria varia]TWU07443.1 putative serine protease HtrA [Stieleria varia]